MSASGNFVWITTSSLRGVAVARRPFPNSVSGGLQHFIVLVIALAFSEKSPNCVDTNGLIETDGTMVQSYK